MSDTPRTDAAVAFVMKQVKNDSPTLCQDHPFYVMDVMAAESKKIERELAAAIAERDEDRRREYGYSQQTVDALTKERDEARAELATLRAENEDLRAKYHDLILSVGNKYPGESRHETAKRYIHQAEHQISSQTDAARAALKEKES